MTEGLFPPYAEPEGPLVRDVDVLNAYAQDHLAGHSKLFHVEGPVLVVDRDQAAALRIDEGTVLVRVDLPDDLQHAKPQVEEALRAAGMELIDEDTLLAAPIAIQVLGLRLSIWDLWGADITGAFEALRRAAAGGEEIPPALGPPPE